MNLLITGGTGYFGHAFAKAMLDRGDYERICIYSRGEYAQHLMRQKFNDDQRLRFFIGDVRDQQRLELAMRGIDVVVHAAALKRVEVGEYNPTEMIQTNVDGAKNVIQAALNTGEMDVVYLSTDKACAPLNAYGASKLMGEKMMLAANNVAGAKGPRFAVTRYGNVAGSTGSVIPIWRSITKDRASRTTSPAILPITHPGCTRFWMSAQEAVDLVEWTIMNMTGGEIVVPSLPAYNIVDLATAMGAGAQITGLKPGEKLHEEMLTAAEAPAFMRHPPTGYWINAPWAEPIGCFEVRQAGMSSETARRMTIEEIRTRLEEIDG